MAPPTIKGYPLMNKSEVDYICEMVTKDHTMFEWGSGNSTLFFSKICKSICSVEHDEKWFDRIANIIIEEKINNVSLILKPPTLVPFKSCTNGWSIINDMRSLEFIEYIKAIDLFGHKKYDFFVLDGRARPQCAEYALHYSHDETIVFMQEFYRQRYSVALEWYDLIDRVDNMAVLKAKKKYLNWLPEITSYEKA